MKSITLEVISALSDAHSFECLLIVGEKLRVFSSTSGILNSSSYFDNSHPIFNQNITYHENDLIYKAYTHLMHAIGHFVLENHTHLKVLYISSEMFTNEFIKALSNSKKTGGMSAFQRKYRSIEFLIFYIPP